MQSSLVRVRIIPPEAGSSETSFLYHTGTDARRNLMMYLKTSGRASSHGHADMIADKFNILLWLSEIPDSLLSLGFKDELIDLAKLDSF